MLVIRKVVPKGLGVCTLLCVHKRTMRHSSLEVPLTYPEVREFMEGIRSVNNKGSDYV